MFRPLQCWHCGDVIGVYEPLVLIAEGTLKVTSLAQEPSAGDELSAAFHLACAESSGILQPVVR